LTLPHNLLLEPTLRSQRGRALRYTAMTRFIHRIKSLFTGAASSPSPDAEDPLSYDEIVNLDAEDLAEQGILSAYRELLPRLRQYLASPPIEVSEEIDDDLARYIVHAGARRYVIWEDGAHNEDGWERATVALFRNCERELGTVAVQVLRALRRKRSQWNIPYRRAIRRSSPCTRETLRLAVVAGQ
jgi:hypothetical protein